MRSFITEATLRAEYRSEVLSTFRGERGLFIERECHVEYVPFNAAPETDDDSDTYYDLGNPIA